MAGGMFIGTANRILQFEQLYKRAINYFLDKKIRNTDQQVLYSLYSKEGRQALKPEIELQPEGDNPFV
jgi:predicted transposase YdaD